MASNNSLIKAWGKRKVTLRISPRRSFTQEFHIADVTEPILGAYFFIANVLDIDMSRCRLISMADLATIPMRSARQSPSVTGIHMPSVNAADRIITEFLELLIFCFKPTDTNKHGVEHHIITSGPPLHARAHHLDTNKLAVVKAEIAKMEQLRIIRCSSFPWASPVHMVYKPGEAGDLAATFVHSTT